MWSFLTIAYLESTLEDLLHIVKVTLTWRMLGGKDLRRWRRALSSILLDGLTDFVLHYVEKHH